MKIVLDEDLFRGVGLTALKKMVIQFYTENIKGKTVTNKEKGIVIRFPTTGIKHLVFGRNPGYQKLKAVFVLLDMVKSAKFSNFKNPDSTDKAKNIVGYMHFISRPVIEGAKQEIRIVIRITKDGKYYYDHVMRVKKSP